MNWHALFLPALFCSVIACGNNNASNIEFVRQPLELAADNGDLAEVQRLIAAGADIDGYGGDFNPLVQASSYEKDIEIVRALLAAGADPNGRGLREGVCWVSPLGRATSSDNVEATRLLLEAGASIDGACYRPEPGYLTPPVIDLLVDYGLDLQELDDRGRNALHIVLQPPTMPRREGVEYLIHAGVPLNATDADGKTPLAYWQEPRYHEIFNFRRWVFDTVFGEHRRAENDRRQRAEITEMLTAAGATL